jgi:hypothetical protein
MQCIEKDKVNLKFSAFEIRKIGNHYLCRKSIQGMIEYFLVCFSVITLSPKIGFTISGFIMKKKEREQLKCYDNLSLFFSTFRNKPVYKSWINSSYSCYGILLNEEEAMEMLMDF